MSPYAVRPFGFSCAFRLTIYCEYILHKTTYYKHIFIPLAFCAFIIMYGIQLPIHFYRSPDAFYPILEDLRCSRQRSTGSSLRKVFRKRGLPLRLTILSSTRLFLSLVASFTQTRPFIHLKAASRYLYKLCHSRSDGRHNLYHAGTNLKCSSVLELKFCIVLKYLF